MSDSNNNTSVSKVKSVLNWAIGLDAAFAFIVATLNAIFQTEAGSSIVGTIFSVALNWVLSFGEAFLQGGIFFLVLGGFVAVSYFLLGLFSRAKKSLTGRFEKKK